MNPPSKTAHFILQQQSFPEPRLPPIGELAALARAYLALSDADLLGQTGAIFVTDSAAATYASAEDIGESEARRELTELLLDARRVADEPGKPERWRMRSRSSGLDVTARVSREGRLVVVVAVSVREMNVGGRGGGRAR